MPLAQAPAYWHNRVFTESYEIRIAQAQLQKAQAQGERARADKMPDPTLGIYRASEVGGQERITGLTISIPIPGSQRNRRAAQALHEAEVTRQAVELKKREVESELAVAIATTDGAYESFQIADAGAASMQNNANLMQRAYSLGEADLQALLSARRQATSAAQNALAARITAIRNYYLLLIDARLAWDFE